MLARRYPRYGGARHGKEGDSDADRDGWKPSSNRVYVVFRTALLHGGRSGNWGNLVGRTRWQPLLLVGRLLGGDLGSSPDPRKAPWFPSVHCSFYRHRIVVVVGGRTKRLGPGTPSRGTRQLDGWCFGIPSRITDSQSHAHPKPRPRDVSCFWCRPLFRGL